MLDRLAVTVVVVVVVEVARWRRREEARCEDIAALQTMTKQTQADAEPIVIERIVEQPPQIIQLPPQQPVIQERAFKQTTTKRRIEKDEADDLDGNGYIHDDFIKVRSIRFFFPMPSFLFLHC